MTFDIHTFAKEIALLTSAEIADKYKGKVPKDTKIADVVDSIERQGLLDRLIRTDWKNDGSDKNGLYLIRSSLKFEVFTGERGLKNWKEEFSDIRLAAAAWIDGLLNELLHSAPDTRIK
ncbi:MAG: hypothetical protein KA436_12335 [Oligoflexales bacterium]|nr:hypothetical protein [Oligoflexales bacterium]